jgi:acetoin utilization deacetylase AcuC-like enzyme
VRDLATRLDIPLGAVLEGGYQPQVLAACVLDTMTALSGVQPARSAPPEALLSSRAAAHVGHYWSL